MASQGVSGKTPDELVEMRSTFAQTNRSDHYDFEECFCLAKIPRQPEEYDGPDRFCSSRKLKNGYRCKHHGGASSGNPENLEKLANMKHGMYATDEHLRETMIEREEELYDWVLSWPETYGIPLEEDPSAAHDFQTLATEIVREARGKDYILRNSEIREKGVYLPDGTMVETEELPNTLGEAMASQVRLIQKIKDSLGITRKQQAKDENAKTANEVMDSMAGAMSDLVGDAAGYDPDDFEEPGGE